MKSKILSLNQLLILLLTISIVSCSSDDSVANSAPKAFDLIEIADGATDIEVLPTLLWEPASDPDGDAVTYTVMVDTVNPPQLVVAKDLKVTLFKTNTELLPQTTYFWTVLATDSEGNTTTSEISKFTTRKKTNAELILGKWFFNKIDSEDVDSCQQQSYYEFYENLTVIAESFTEDDDDGGCNSMKAAGVYEFVSENSFLIGSTSDNYQIYDILELTETDLVFGDENISISFKK